MATIDLKSIIGRLDPQCRRALEAAAGLTLSRTHYNVEIEHWLSKLLDAADTDVAAIVRHYDVDPGRLARDLETSLDRMKTGSARAPALSPDIVDLVKQGWLMASIEHGRDPGAVRPPAMGAAGRRYAVAPRAGDVGRVRQDPGGHAEARFRGRHAGQRRSRGGNQRRRRLAGGIRGRCRAAPGRHRFARPLHHRPDGEGALRRASTRSSAATPRSGS